MSGVTDQSRCESTAPIVKFDTGPVRCTRETGHKGDHYGRDYDHDVYPHESWRAWRDMPDGSQRILGPNEQRVYS